MSQDGDHGKRNGSNGNGKWESKAHNKVLTKMFKKKIVDKIRDIDLADKRLYDDADEVLENIKKARERLQASSYGADELCAPEEK